MSLQILLPLSPFLALIYALYALIQVLRKKRQGTVAALLALVAILAPTAALVFTNTTVIQSAVIRYMTLNAVILFVVSLALMLLERRNPARDTSRSYGMLGVGMSIVFAAALFLSPVLFGEQTASASTGADSGTLQNVRALSSETLASQTGDTETTDEAAVQPTEPTAVAQVLMTQTGLTVDEMTEAIESGTTIADLVAANNGDLDAVITAITETLDAMIAAGGPQAQMFSQFGDTATIATQIAQGELPDAVQERLVPRLLTGETASPPTGETGTRDSSLPAFPNSDSADGSFPAFPDSVSGNPDAATVNPSAEETAEPAPDQTEAATIQTTEEPRSEPINLPESTPEAEQPAVEAASTPEPSTETVVRPTRITFPTATPTPEPSESEQAESTPTAPREALCAITVDFNLNLRDQPNTDGNIYLSIPFGTSVSADGRSADGWYSVSYNGQSGWVSGEYVTAGVSCDSLPVLDAGG